MYTLFVEKCFPDIYKEMTENDVNPEKYNCPVKYKFYHDYFKENFNYGLGRPRTDVCGTCEELKVKITSQKMETLESDWRHNFCCTRKELSVFTISSKLAMKKQKTKSTRKLFALILKKIFLFLSCQLAKYFTKGNFGLCIFWQK